MEEGKVIEIHDEIFNHLMEWHKNVPEDEINPYFYIRTHDDKRFSKGYWFHGGDNYIAVSFWAGGDSANKTQNIYLNIDFDKGASIIFTGRDSEYKKGYFEKLAMQLTGFTNRQNGSWAKHVADFNDNYLYVIDNFICNEKKLIDLFIKSAITAANDGENLIDKDEFSSPFGFLDDKFFDKYSSRVLQEKLRRQRHERIHSFFGDDIKGNGINLTSKPLPIALESIEIKNYRGITKCGPLQLSDAAQWIFLTGENGYGKSCVLQAIALGITNYPENKGYLKEGKISTTFIKDNNVFVKATTFSYDDKTELLNDYFIGYGPIRLNPQTDSAENKEGENSTNIFNLFHSTGLLKSLKYLLTKTYLTGEPGFNRLKATLIKALDGRIEDIRFDKEKEDFIFIEKINTDELLEGVTYHQLASGFVSTLNLIGDIIVRFSKSQPNNSFQEFKGIIIIDELENHLHPVMQKKLPDLLSGIFPNIQFIASTHSPIPLLGASANSIIIHVTRSAEFGIRTERLEGIVDLMNVNPNILLTSPIFGFKDLFPTGHDTETGRINTDNTFTELQFRKLLKNKLNDFLQNKEQ